MERVIIISDLDDFEAFRAAHSNDWQEFLWHIGIDYKPFDGTLIYGTANRGYKPGGFTLGSFAKADFDAEYCLAYETGWKQLWMSDRFSTTLSGYYYDYKDLQMSSMVGLVNMIGNAVSTEIYGVEFELTGYIIENFLASLSYSYLHTEFKEYPGQFDQFQPSKGVWDPIDKRYEQDLSGNPLPDSPENKISINLTYTLPTDVGDFAVHGLYFWQDKRYTSKFATPERGGEAYDRVDGEVMWNSPGYKWRVSLWVKNAFDVTTLSSQTVGGANEGFYRIATYIPPLTYGVDVSFKW